MNLERWACKGLIPSILAPGEGLIGRKLDSAEKKIEYSLKEFM
jgi:hypothetical protein